ncbi:MAG TPA: hypothetical protein DER67_02800 [Novosphingobium sp.]|nr:hypothetical protein [Novosphingobium sp.]
MLEWWPLTTAEAATRVAEHTANGGAVRSALGHADIAGLVSRLLAYPLALDRSSVTLILGDQALVCQYRGPRLAEETTRLPDDARLDWYWLRDWSLAPGEPVTASSLDDVFAAWRAAHAVAQRWTSGD